MSRLVLVDTASAYFRAFHGIPTSVRSPDGRPVNAVRGLLDVLAHIVATRRPDELVCCWDVDWRPVWRVALVPGYKQHRVATAEGGSPGSAGAEEVPSELAPQVEVIREVLAAVGVPVVGADEHEADDVMATLAADGQRRGLEVDLVTGDRDLFQLATNPDVATPVRVVYTGRGNARVLVLDAVSIASRYGIPPGTYREFATLRGDPSDGLPGVPGVGDRTAAQLLGRFGGLAAIVAAARAGDAGMTASVRSKLLAARRRPAGDGAGGPGRGRPAHRGPEGRVAGPDPAGGPRVAVPAGQRPRTARIGRPARRRARLGRLTPQHSARRRGFSGSARSGVASARGRSQVAGANAQNSLPSGSASTHQSTPSPRSRTTRAPAATSAAGSEAPRSTSQCHRFFADFGSGTGWKTSASHGNPAAPGHPGAAVLGLPPAPERARPPVGLCHRVAAVHDHLEHTGPLRRVVAGPRRERTELVALRVGHHPPGLVGDRAAQDRPASGDEGVRGAGRDPDVDVHPGLDPAVLRDGVHPQPPAALSGRRGRVQPNGAVAAVDEVQPEGPPPEAAERDGVAGVRAEVLPRAQARPGPDGGRGRSAGHGAPPCRTGPAPARPDARRTVAFAGIRRRRATVLSLVVPVLSCWPLLLTVDSRWPGCWPGGVPRPPVQVTAVAHPTPRPGVRVVTLRDRAPRDPREPARDVGAVSRWRVSQRLTAVPMLSGWSSGAMCPAGPTASTSSAANVVSAQAMTSGDPIPTGGSTVMRSLGMSGVWAPTLKIH